ncbi:MAG: hypothetical protein ACI8Y7_000630, partial [Candidatus Woesearchaeota archaeon]
MPALIEPPCTNTPTLFPSLLTSEDDGESSYFALLGAMKNSETNSTLDELKRRRHANSPAVNLEYIAAWDPVLLWCQDHDHNSGSHVYENGVVFKIDNKGYLTTRIFETVVQEKYEDAWTSLGLYNNEYTLIPERTHEPEQEKKPFCIETMAERIQSPSDLAKVQGTPSYRFGAWLIASYRFLQEPDPASNFFLDANHFREQVLGRLFPKKTEFPEKTA